MLNILAMQITSLKMSYHLFRLGVLSCHLRHIQEEGEEVAEVHPVALLYPVADSIQAAAQ